MFLVRTTALVTILLFGFLDALPAQGQERARYVFGFSLNPTPQGELYSLFIYSVLHDQVIEGIPMRTKPYILQAAGLQESRANLEFLDLFDAYGIIHCGAWTDELGVHVGFECPPINDLWKLYYREDVAYNRGSGWAAEEFRPSTRQQILLGAYRSPAYEHWKGPYFGEDAFRLLRDMQDPAWVKTYLEGG